MWKDLSFKKKKKRCLFTPFSSLLFCHFSFSLSMQFFALYLIHSSFMPVFRSDSGVSLLFPQYDCLTLISVSLLLSSFLIQSTFSCLQGSNIVALHHPSPLHMIYHSVLSLALWWFPVFSYLSNYIMQIWK